MTHVALSKTAGAAGMATVCARVLRDQSVRTLDARARRPLSTLGGCAVVVEECGRTDRSRPLPTPVLVASGDGG